MRVILISFGFTEIVIEQANSLSKYCEVVLVIPKINLDKEHYQALSDKVTLETFTTYRQLNPMSIVMFGRILKIINKYSPDIIHIQAHCSTWFFVIMPFLCKYPIVNTIHDPTPHSGDKNNKGRMISEFFGKMVTSKYVVHGNLLREDLIKNYKLDRRSTLVINHGGYSSFIESKKIKRDMKTNSILFFGRIWRYKGLEYLLKSQKLINKIVPDYKIIIAGTGEDIAIYDKHIVKEKTTLHNYRISLKEMFFLFKNSSVVVLPYLDATQSGIVPLAYEFAKPVVVTSVGSIPEVVKNGREGIIVKPRSSKDLGLAISYILKNKDIQNIYGNNGSIRLKTELSWDIGMKKMHEVYKKLVDC